RGPPPAVPRPLELSPAARLGPGPTPSAPQLLDLRSKPAQAALRERGQRVVDTPSLGLSAAAAARDSEMIGAAPRDALWSRAAAIDSPSAAIRSTLARASSSRPRRYASRFIPASPPRSDVHARAGGRQRPPRPSG